MSRWGATADVSSGAPLCERNRFSESDCFTRSHTLLTAPKVALWPSGDRNIVSGIARYSMRFGSGGAIYVSEAAKPGLKGNSRYS